MAYNSRLSPPLMFVFRSAHEQADARVSDLRQEGGDSLIEDLRRRSRFAVTEAVLRREVARDLENLMNSIALESTQDLRAMPEVRNSILNYGFPDLAHRALDEASVVEVASEIKSVLTRYEPRLAAESIKVWRDTEVDATALRLRFIVQARLYRDPIDVPVEFIADVEYDSGKVAISRI
jgi:type VI secretion system protein ImpF